MLYDVFISHSSQDKAVADAICHVFEQNGIRCWIAPRDVRPGFNYGSELIEGILACKIMVLIFSEYSNTSEFVQSEIERAFSNQKIIIPYRISNTDMNKNLEFFLSGKHWIDAYAEENQFHSLLRAAANVLGITLNMEQTTADSDHLQPVKSVQMEKAKPSKIFSPTVQKEDSARGNTWGNAGSFGIAAACGGWIYYTNGPSICKMREDGSEDQEIIELGVLLFQVVDDWIYYRENNYYVYRIKTDGSDRQTVFGWAVFHFCVYGDYILLGNSTDGGKLYRSKTDGSDLSKLSEQKVVSFIAVEGNMVYYGTENDGWFRVLVNGGEAESLKVFGSHPNYVNGWIYYLGEEFSSLSKVRPDGTENQEVNPARRWNLNATSSHLYIVDSNSKNVFRMNMDGKNKELVYDGEVNNVCIAGDWLFTSDMRNSMLRRMKTDGSQLTTMQKLQG